MPKHKAATEVTLAREEGSELNLWIERNWKLMAGLVVLVAVSILTFQYVRERRKEALVESWDRIWALVQPGRSLASFSGDPAALAAAFPRLERTEAGPWALYLKAQVLAGERRYDEARQALLQLQEAYPAHPLVRERYPIGAGSTPLTLVENLAQSLRSVAEWESEREHLFGNPPPPSGAPQVRLETSEGAIVVQLYPEHAPKHVDNFLKLVREGFYDGTRFHRVEPQFMIQGGDPHSREDDRGLWGTGGPGYGLDPEENELRHFPGYLAAAKPGGATESSGSQFYITVAAAHHLDGEHVVFGKVLEGMDVAHRIEAGRLDPSPQRRGQPVDPVTVLSAQVL